MTAGVEVSGFVAKLRRKTIALRDSYDLDHVYTGRFVYPDFTAPEIRPVRELHRNFAIKRACLPPIDLT